MGDIIAAKNDVSKFFYNYGFHKLLTSIPQNRLGDIITGLALKGNQSRTTDFAELKQGCRTTYGHFLSADKWDEGKVSEHQQQEAFQKLAGMAQANQVPLYLSIDDTVIEKKQPSSQAKPPMGGHISTGNTSLCYSLRRVCPENGSKIDMAVQLLDSLPETSVNIIFQMDSWYTCKTLWDCQSCKRPIPSCYSGRSQVLDSSL